MKLSTKYSFAIALAMAVSLFIWQAPQASAAIVTYQFEGNVAEMSPDLHSSVLAGGFNQTQKLLVNMSVNSVPDFNPSANIGKYAITGLNFSIGSHAGTLGLGPNFVEVQNLTPGPDAFRVRLSDPASVSPLAGSLASLFHIDLVTHPNVSVFTNDALPSVPNIASFLQNGWRLQFADGSFVRGTITAAVPLPTGLVLFGTGLIALAALGTGGLRNFRRTDA